ncbi:MAG: Protein of unknown function (DUF1553)/Protein of unknown function (DUF1549)/Planctomycete [Planctomycetaceae bacterium]|nr:Protein of unknown function (DUF1553)/Protein of unknown function (DUF1549)/Planctomycete [Planctomycetaceae bacterium]
MLGRVILAFGLICVANIARADEPVDFSRGILPILSDKCYHCHGPDEQTRKAELRFDTRMGAFRVLDGHSVIVPGKSADSELYRRITSSDPEELMPPKSANRALTPRQIELLKRWIDQGAKWGTHWAFDAPRRPDLPGVQRADWVRNAIDRFVLAKLEQQKLSPSPEATKEILIRRLTFDLTGLPPTLAEIDVFVADQSPQAYERLVDRLLESPRFGERMASEWLDVARYADTHGYQMDRFRPMWPYRDWVVRAFNQNLPFDQFVTWQLAGDLLPHASRDQRLATAFNRLHMQNEEGGVVEEEFRVAYVVDRVNTVGTAFLGLTLECSRCHDHKYDPITQKDFYSLFSFFQNIDESGQTSYFTGAMPVPTLLLTNDDLDARLADFETRIRQNEQQIKALKDSSQAAFQEWLGARKEIPPISGVAATFSLEALEANRAANSVDVTKPANAVESPGIVEGKVGKGLSLNGDNGLTFPGIGHFTRVDPFSLSLWLKTPTHAPRMVVAHHSRAPIDAGSRGYELLLENGQVAFGLHHMWPRNSLKVRTKSSVPVETWTQVTVTYDGSSRAAGVQIYLNGEPAELEIVRDGLFKDITYGGEPDLAIGYRFRDNGFKGGAVDEFQIFNRALTRLEAARLAGKNSFAEAWSTPADKLTEAQRQGLFDLFFATAFPPAKALQDSLLALRRDHNAVVTPIPEAMVMEELPNPKPAHVLKRGAYDAPGDEVTANTPSALPPFPKDQPHNRLGLARWLLNPQHPLTARVSVNRYWQTLFGKGIVQTSDNFGSQGAQPSHPELLDWLALEFSEGSLPGAGTEQRKPWDVKQFLKLLVMSATYRQSSVANQQALSLDPANQWLARGPSKRLTAEMLRDAALFTSGQLIDKMGGPSVKPYQPPGLWEIAMGRPQYDQGHGDELHRRSLYTYWKRTVPPPSMVTFDSSERNVCVAQRQSTSTPLQALALLNDVQIIEAARMAAQRMLKEGGATDESRAQWLFRTVIGRHSSERETAILIKLLKEQRELFTADKPQAEKLLTVGEAKNEKTLDPVELAAGTVLAEAIFNLDEAIMRR